jgi:hypothetical protein
MSGRGEPIVTFRAGAAEVVITPPIGTRLEGYGARVGGSVSVHDDLHARAVAFDDGTTAGAIVACDLVGIDRRLTQRVRDLVHTATGMPGAHVMISATHTHAGPGGLRADLDPGLTDVLTRQIAGAVAAAHAELRPSTLKTHAGRIDTVSQNRRDPSGPIDDELQVLVFDSPDRRAPPIASIVNFACHATVLYHTNMLISADYPGATVETVKRLAGDAPVLFLNGACGDVNPIWIEQDYDEAERIGSIVGAEAARRLQEVRPHGHRQQAWNIRWDELTERPPAGTWVAEPRVRIASRSVDVPLRRLEAPDSYAPRIQQLTEALDRAPTGTGDRRALMEQLNFLRSTRDVAVRIGNAGAHVLHPEIQAIAFGVEAAILGLPGEFFAETGMALREAAPFSRLFIACYSNHHVFYVVPRHAWDEGGYEPGVSVLDETADDLFRSAARGLLADLAGPGAA